DVRRLRAADHREAGGRRRRPQRREDHGPERRRVRALRHRRRAGRCEYLRHRRIRHRGPRGRVRSVHGPARRSPGPRGSQGRPRPGRQPPGWREPLRHRPHRAVRGDRPPLPPGWAALASGTGEAILEYTKKYVNEREAFGEPISHRQPVAFMVANLRIELDGLRLIMLRGASRLDQGMSYHREAGLARRYASDKGMVMGLDGVQLLGGHGYTKEHPVERWYRDMRAIG